MRALLILGVIALFCVLLCLLPVGMEFRHAGGESTVRIRVGPFRLRMGDGGKRGRGSERRAAKKHAKKSKEDGAKPSLLADVQFSAADVGVLGRIVLRALGRLRRGLTVHLLHLDVTCGGPPERIGLVYAGVNAVVSVLLPQLLRAVRVRKRRIAVRFDFACPRIRMEADIRVTIRIGAVLSAGWRLFWPLLRWLLGKKATARREADKGAARGCEAA